NDAPAENEIRYMIGNSNEVSFHVAVDDKEAVQGIPFDRNAWHCGDGDGNGTGNRGSIGVEICYSKSGGSRYYKAEDNAAIVIAQLMKQFCIPIGNVVPHQHWSRKYCPHRMLDEGRVPSFIERIKQAHEGKVDKNNKEWWKMEMNLTLDQWRQLAEELGRMYQDSVNGKIVPPVLNDYRWVEKASKCEMTPEELMTVMSIIKMRKIV
ncbi:N-acetylmuramoyl-L-alanine amidase, partial [Paenibacillus larvae]